MKIMWFAVIAAACGSAAPPAQPIQNCAAQPAKSCATVIAKAAALSHQSGREVTMTIGHCAQDDWAEPVRDCIDAATTTDALKACGKQYALKGSMFNASSASEALEAMVKFKDQMCACKDQACTKTVTDAMTKWSVDHKDDVSGSMKLTDEEMKRATNISDELAKCMMKTMSGGTP